MDLNARLERIDAIRAGWTADADAIRTLTIEQTAEASGLPTGMVETQLDAVIRRAEPAAMLDRIRAAYGTTDVLESAPRRILHLIAGSVPGLAVESLLWSLLTPATNVVVPSRHDPSVRMVARLAGAASKIATEPDFSCDGVIVMGRDDTVALVRQRLGPAARVSAFGNRVSFALGDATAVIDAAPQLADDIARFAQRGCMSPSRILVTGTHTEADVAAVATALGDALHEYAIQGGLPTPDPIDERRNADLAALIATQPMPARRAAYGSIGVEVEAAPALRSLNEQLTAPISTVVACGAARLSDEWVAALRAAGASRIVGPGSAHELDTAHWHEGVGHLAGLLAC